MKKSLFHYDLENDTVESFRHTIIGQSFIPNDFNLIGMMDFGFNYLLTEKLFLHTFLAGNMTILPTIQSLSFNNRHFNIGLGFGVGYFL